MDHVTARKILGVSEEASFEEIRKRFRALARLHHPDLNPGKSSEKFILISTAYLVLQGKELGVNINKNSSDDIMYAVNLKDNIEQHFQNVMESFIVSMKSIEAGTKIIIKESIYSSESISELKKNINGSVKDELLDANSRITMLLKKLSASMSGNDLDFIFELFKDMYEVRRKYWIINLYRNPIVIVQGFGAVIYACAQAAPSLYRLFPHSFQGAALGWIVFCLFSVGIPVLLLQFLSLNPRNQYLPPRLSISGIQSIISKTSTGIGESKTDLALGGGAIGGLIGTMVFPGIGTIVGAALGALLGLTGDDLDESKNKSYTKIISDFQRGISMINSEILAWSERAKSDLHRASVESFTKNIRKISILIKNRKILLLSDQSVKH